MAADMRYEYIDKVVDKSVFKPDKKNLTKSDKIDKIVTNRVLALSYICCNNVSSFCLYIQ